MHLISKARQYEDLLNDHFKAKLGKKVYNQFLHAVRSPQDRFWHELVQPNLLLCEDGEQVTFGETITLSDDDLLRDLGGSDWGEIDKDQRPAYICLSQSKYIAGRNQLETLAHLSKADRQSGKTIDTRHSISFFTNAMRFGAMHDGEWDAPSDRVTLGPLTIFTIEIDPPSGWTQQQKITLLEEQMSWFRRSGNSAKSAPVFRIVGWLNQFSDFRGVVANYSGNKSIHFHFVFDTAEIVASSPDLRDHVRPAYQEAWQRLSQRFAELLPLDADHDIALRHPEQFRRLPNGANIVESAKTHLFDVPTGTSVPQITLFEHLISIAPKNAKRTFLEPLEIKRLSSAIRTKARAGLQQTSGEWHSDDERMYCFKKLQEVVEKRLCGAQYPKLADLEFSNQVKAKFFADEHDQSPNVLLFEDQQRAIACGGRRPKHELVLLQPLGRYLHRWRVEWRRKNNVSTECWQGFSEPVQSSQILSGGFSVEEARKRFREELESEIAQNDILFVKGPEGLGKTTAAMRLLPKLAEQHKSRKAKPFEEQAPDYRARLAQSTLSVVATASYEQAAEKCAQFDNMHPDDGHVAGVVFQSFDRLYCLALEEQFSDDWRDKKIDSLKAAQLGHSSVLSAIRDKQSNIWERLRLLHQQMLAPLMRADHGVLFTVHEVLHQWSEGGLSRLFAHPDFFEMATDDLWKLTDGTELTVAIHDEISIPHFLRVEPISMVNWCVELFDQHSVWGEQHPNLATAFASFQEHKSSHMGDVSFADVVRLHRNDIDAYTPIGVGPIEKYGFDRTFGRSWPMYESRHSLQFAYQKRCWWNGLAENTIVLTTEELSTEIFRTISVNEIGGMVLDASGLMQSVGSVSLHVVPSLKSSNNAELANEMREHLGCAELHVICNSARELSDHSTYIGAKGRNDLADRDILQIMNFVAPEKGTSCGQYEQLQIINQIYGLRNAIKLFHIDQFNQAVGRNLGFRHQGREHHFVLSQELFSEIEEPLVQESRYQIERVLSAKQRRDKSHNADKTLLAKLKQEEEDLQAAEHHQLLPALAWIDAQMDRERDRLLGPDEDMVTWNLLSQVGDCIGCAFQHRLSG